MAGGQRQGPLLAHMVLPTLEESDASQAIKNASKHVVGDEATQTKRPASACRSSTTKKVCRDPHLGNGCCKGQDCN
eukprot:3185501-Prorocentrum_lima.AAC.1